jgi:hypothetical protein
MEWLRIWPVPGFRTASLVYVATASKIKYTVINYLMYDSRNLNKSKFYPGRN